MTKAEQLRAIAYRCEAASGPDRELDHAIYEALGNPVVRCASASTHGTDLVNWAPFYTASLDAAVTLVPSGWAFSLGSLMGLPLERRWRCHLRDHNEPYNPATCSWIDSDLTTPALAICAAALRALAEKEEA